MHSGAILAGGRATRFDGRDKGALLVGGRSIRDRQLHELSQVADEILLVGASVAPSVPGLTIRLVADRVRGAGPLGGLDAALAACRRDHAGSRRIDDHHIRRIGAPAGLRGKRFHRRVDRLHVAASLLRIVRKIGARYSVAFDRRH